MNFCCWPSSLAGRRFQQQQPKTTMRTIPLQCTLWDKDGEPIFIAADYSDDKITITRAKDYDGQVVELTAEQKDEAIKKLEF